MRLLRAAIVDDEPLARARLRRLLGDESTVDVVAEFGDGATAARELAGLGVDAVFADVRMPQVDGFAMLERIPPHVRPLVVFVTAYSEHAVQAFDARAFDYLMKPVAPDRLHRALERLLGQLTAIHTNPPQRMEAAQSDGYLQRLPVPDGGRMRIIDVQDIECVLAQGNYVELKVAGRTLLLRETMSELQMRLDPRRFLRIHRSRIVRLDLIEQVEPYGAGKYLLRMRNGLRMTSGRGYRAQLRHALGLGRSDNQQQRLPPFL